VAAVLLLAVGAMLARSSASPSPQPGGPYPIYDTHLHYSQDAWSAYTPDEILQLMDQAGVYRALVSSTPDDGTLLLYERALGRIVPILRPYRIRADMLTWTRDTSVLDYVTERLSAGQGAYRGIGEFHLSAGQAGDPVPLGLVALALEHDLVLHAHADDQAVAELAALDPAVRVLWAHAGMSASPLTVERLLDRFPNLTVELALRSDVAPGGELDPAWSSLFVRYPDRVMVGTDTWIVPQWTNLAEIMGRVQGWLAQLPPDVAERIAWRNAERQFGR
jgi:hypothetical protein